MSIFDTIRYPISCPPTEAELSALPENLYRKWGERFWPYSTSPDAVSAIMIGYMLNGTPDEKRKTIDHIENLRWRISEL
jgi:hypothetical protein